MVSANEAGAHLRNDEKRVEPLEDDELETREAVRPLVFRRDAEGDRQEDSKDAREHRRDDACRDKGMMVSFAPGEKSQTAHRRRARTTGGWQKEVSAASVAAEPGGTTDPVVSRLPLFEESQILGEGRQVGDDRDECERDGVPACEKPRGPSARCSEEQPTN